MAKAEKVPLEAIQLPSKRDYVRHGIEESHIAHLRSFLPKKDPKPTDWPFPPVMLYPLKSPSGKIKYGIHDGVHRTCLAQELEFKDIPATIEERGKDGFANLLTQLAYNLKHGLLITKQDRNAAIRRLRGGGYSLEQISKETGLHVSQISRISTGAKTYKPKPRTPQAQAPVGEPTNGQALMKRASMELDRVKTLHVECPGCHLAFPVAGNEVLL